MPRSFFFILLIINSLSAMVAPRETSWFDTMPHEKRELILKGNYYDPEPHAQAPLEYDYVMTQFWKKLKKSGTQEQKDAELKEVLKSKIFSWPLQRYYIAAAALSGANLSTLGNDQENALILACKRQDGALVDCLFHHNVNLPEAEALHYQKFVLFNVEKTSLARYLISKGAQTSLYTRMGSTLLHTSMHVNYNSGLVKLYLDQGIPWNAHTSDGYNVLHQLAKHSSAYADKLPKMLKKFNYIMNHVTPEQALQLLSERIKFINRLPEEECVSFFDLEASRLLARIMKTKREALELALAR